MLFLAKLVMRETFSEYDRGPIWVTIYREDGTVANLGDDHAR